MSETKSDARLHIGISPMVKKAMEGFKISRAVRVRDWLLTNGQMDIGDGGKVLNPDDISAQTVACMRSIYEVVAKADRRLAELVQVQVFYLAGAIASEAAFRAQILEEFPECRDALLVFTPVPSFATIGHVVEIDAIAVKGRRVLARDETGVVRGVRRGDWVFASARGGVAELGATLAKLECELSDVCRLYAYFSGGISQEQRTTIERDLADAFRKAPPAYHAALLPKKSDAVFDVELEVIANTMTEKARYGRATAPHAGLNWPFANALRCGDLIFASGQFPVDEAGAIVHPKDIASQARAAMTRLSGALNQAGAQMGDLAKIKTYFEGAWDMENWFANLRARMESLSDPGPASTGIEGLPPVMPGALLSVDGIAIRDAQT